MTIADEIAAELRAIRTSLRAQHFARLDMETELIELHARLARLTERLSTPPANPLFSDGGGI